METFSKNPSVLLNAKEMIFSKTNQEASQKLAFKGYRTGRALFENFFTAGVAILSSLLFFDLYWDIAGQPNIFKTSSLKFLDNAPDDHNFEFYVYIQFLRNHGAFKRFEAPFLKRKFGISSWDKGFLSKVKHAKSVFRYILKLRFKKLIFSQNSGFFVQIASISKSEQIFANSILLKQDLFCSSGDTRQILKDALFNDKSFFI